MCLGAVPLLARAEGAILRQVHATVSAAHHQGRVGLAGTLLPGDRALEFSPEPYRGSNNGNPEQNTKHDGQFLDKECASLAKDLAGAQRNNATHKKGSPEGLPFYVASADQSNTPKVM